MPTIPRFVATKGQMNRTLCSSIYRRISNKSTLTMFEMAMDVECLTFYLAGKEANKFTLYRHSSVGPETAQHKQMMYFRAKRLSK